MSNQDEKVNWVTVINFLEKEYTQASIRQREWKYEKEILTSRISSLEAELRSNVIVCEDLINRIKILQIALKEEKSKRSNGKTLMDSKQIASMIDKLSFSKQIDKSTHEQFLQDLTKDLKFLREDPPKFVEDLTDNGQRSINNQRTLNERRKFGAHLDVVTALIPLESNTESLFATASEDCLIKVWSLPNALKQECPQPKHTLRKHTGPLFSLAGGPNPHNKSEYVLFSGGIEGDIKSWRLDRAVAEWTGSWMNGAEEEQTIWELQMLEDKLLSCSSDGFVRMFKINQSQKLELTMLKEFKEKQYNHATAKFISEQFFLASCSSAPRLHLWDVEGNLCQRYIYQSEKGKESSLLQANKLQASKDLKMVVAGCEDGFVRCFDYSNTKVIKKLQVNASVTSLLALEWEITAGDHKGALHIWDSRTYKLLETRESTHLQKYQTGITSLAKLGNYVLSSGADGIVKIFN